ncbi:carboxymuconolactone decarboxylase family protein [Klebsiella pneumoniae subsp. pneumoniae]|nr:carboxymuconolactone decarboxylase family protein [Klebsiella pneumoniae subsp. pneumoniae]
MLSPIRWWGRIPWLFYLVSLFVGYIERRRSPLDPVLRSLVSARIAQLCHCEFCIDITSMTSRRGAEPGQAAGGRRLAQQYAVQRKERLALAYAEAATQTPPALDDALRSAMAAHFDARAITELDRPDRPAKFISAVQCRDGDPGSGVVPDTHLFLAE